MTALSADELGRMLGRDRAWIYEHWPRLVAAREIPPPLHGGKPPLAWDGAQVAAYLDRRLTPAARAAAAAYRAAEAAARAALAPGALEARTDEEVVAAAARRLDQEFGA